MPRLVQVFFRPAPEKVGIAYGWEYVVSLHPAVSVVGPYLQEFGEIFVPGIQVDGHRPLPDPELIYGYGSVVDQLQPANHSSCHAFESPYAAPCRSHFPEV